MRKHSSCPRARRAARERPVLVSIISRLGSPRRSSRRRRVGTIRGVIAQADANSDASNTIELGAGDFTLTKDGGGEVLIQNTSGVTGKTLFIEGQGVATRAILGRSYA